MDWSYIAGYFDGEGHVIFKAFPSRPDYIMIGLTWSNTHLGSLEAMRDFMQRGTIVTGKRKEGHYKPIHRLGLHRVEDIVWAGEAMLSHLIVKNDQVQAMLEWAKLHRSSAPETWGILTEIGVEEITRLYHDEGLTQQQIADKFGVSHGGVSSFFLRNEITGRRRGPQEGAYGILAEHGHEKLLAMYESGMTMSQIAEKLGVRTGTVYMHFYTRGIRLTSRVRHARDVRAGRPARQARPHNAAYEQRMEAVNAATALSTEQLSQWYHDEGKSQATIAELLHVSTSTIKRIFRLRGLEVRPVGHVKGRSLPEEVREKMKATKQQLWADPEFRAKHLVNLEKGREAAKHRPKENYLGGPPPGEAHPQAKLTDEKVSTIRARYAEGGISLSKLAEEHAVSKKTILNIVHRKIWTHVP